jgi:hypothetical protein
MSNTSGHFHSNKSNQTSKEQRGCRDGKGSSSSSSSSSLNDNSNPQQGTGVHRTSASSSAKPQPAAPQRVTLLIPPTVKDARKLFVGGLPSDGT